MALKARENINGTTPQDLNKLNTNFQHVWKTLFGGIDFSSTNNDLKKRIQTQTIPVQGEGNFDKNFPLYIRFYVPSNVKEITTSSFNLICERYRMDSGVAMDSGSIVNANVNMSLASATTGVASVSSPSVGVSSVSSASGYGSTTSLVSRWYPYSATGAKGDYYRPGNRMITKDVFGQLSTDENMVYGDVTGGHILGAKTPMYSDGVALMDLALLNHEHDISITIPAHTHSISLQPHSHSITLSPHTHEASAKIDIPAHTHSLKEGIQISNTSATGVSIKLNGNVITTMDSMSNSTKNNLDVTRFINIGAWNVIECNTLSLARITLYGIIELVIKY